MEGRADVDARAAMLPEVEARRSLRFDCDSYERGLAVAERLGLGLTTVSFADTGVSFFPKFNEIHYAFATRADGSVITGTGEVCLEAAIARNLRLDDSDKATGDAVIGVIGPHDVAKAIRDRDTSGFYQPRSANELTLRIITEREATRSPVATSLVPGL